MATVENRRDFLERCGRLGAGISFGSLLLSACSSRETKPRGGPSQAEALLEEVSKPVTLTELRQYITGLPPSIYRRYVETLCLPLFEENLPPEISFSGVGMPLYASKIETIVWDEDRFRGSASIREFPNPEPNPERIKGAASVSIPVPYLYEDGNGVLVNANFKAGEEVTSGVFPYIALRVPNRALLKGWNPQVADKVRHAVLVKEIFTVTVCMTYLQIIILMMKDMDINPYLPTEGGDKVEVVSIAYATLLNQRGRIAVLADWIPFVLSMKALQGDKPTIEVMRQVSTLNRPITAILASDFGNDIPSLVPTAAKWVIKNRSLMESVGRFDDFDKIP